MIPCILPASVIAQWQGTDRQVNEERCYYMLITWYPAKALGLMTTHSNGVKCKQAHIYNYKIFHPCPHEKREHIIKLQNI